jgi:RNA polymerase sigma-70 factor (ECF subfamily)
MLPLADLTGGTLLEDLDQMFRDNHHWVYRTAYGVTGRSEDAEDVLQNLFLRLLQRGFPPDIRGNARGYLYRAAINLALDSVRSRRRQNLRENLASMLPAAPTMNCGSNEEIEASLLKVVAELEPEKAELLRLRYVDEHSDAEIARMHGTSRGAIAVRLFRTRTRIRSLMKCDHSSSSMQVANREENLTPRFRILPTFCRESRGSVFAADRKDHQRLG